MGRHSGERNSSMGEEEKQEDAAEEDKKVGTNTSFGSLGSMPLVAVGTWQLVSPPRVALISEDPRSRICDLLLVLGSIPREKRAKTQGGATRPKKCRVPNRRSVAGCQTR